MTSAIQTGSVKSIRHSIEAVGALFALAIILLNATATPVATPGNQYLLAGLLLFAALAFLGVLVAHPLYRASAITVAGYGAALAALIVGVITGIAGPILAIPALIAIALSLPSLWAFARGKQN
jgi:hypothetical protein